MPDITAASCMRRDLSLAEELVKSLAAKGKTIAAAESCTAGLAADFIASIPGASDVFWGSFIAYTADAKIKMLGVPEELIKKHGVVSRPVALAMAEGALERSGASWAFSVTGLAGPGGDDRGTPVGTVWIGLSGLDRESLLRSEAKQLYFSGSRNELREAAAAAALEELLKRIHDINA
jgi:PncC family amidohydrolase